MALYLFTSLALEGAALVAWLLSGVLVAPQFDLPMLSSSLGWVECGVGALGSGCQCPNSPSTCCTN